MPRQFCPYNPDIIGASLGSHLVEVDCNVVGTLNIFINIVYIMVQSVSLINTDLIKMFSMLLRVEL